MAANGPDEVDVKALQERVIRDFNQLKDHQDAVKGEFKRIIPLGDGRAVAVMTQATDKDALKKECQYLQSLQQSGVSALNTYGEIFQVGKEKHPAVIVDWIPNATLIDVKHPDAMRATVPAILLGVKVGKGEAGLAFSLTEINKAVDNLLVDSSQFAAIQERAKQLAQAFTELDAQIKSGKLNIVDLQVLVGPDNKLTVIDPQEVLDSKYVDVLDPNKKIEIKNNPDLVMFLNNARELLANHAQMFNAVAKAANPEELSRALKVEPIKKPTAKGGNPLLRQALGKATADRAFEAGRQSAPPATRKSFLTSEGALHRPKSAPASLSSPTEAGATKENLGNDGMPPKPGVRK